MAARRLRGAGHARLALVQVPELVGRVMRGELPVDGFITHRFRGVEGTPDAVKALHGGDCLRAVVSY